MKGLLGSARTFLIDGEKSTSDCSITLNYLFLQMICTAGGPEEKNPLHRDVPDTRPE